MFIIGPNILTLKWFQPLFFVSFSYISNIWNDKFKNNSCPNSIFNPFGLQHNTSLIKVHQSPMRMTLESFLNKSLQSPVCANPNEIESNFGSDRPSVRLTPRWMGKCLISIEVAEHRAQRRKSTMLFSGVVVAFPIVKMAMTIDAFDLIWTFGNSIKIKTILCQLSWIDWIKVPF